MPDKSGRHISPFDAMRLIDDELSDSESVLLQQHVGACEACRDLVFQTRKKLNQVPGIVYSSAPPSDSDDKATGRLQTRLDKASDDGTRTTWHQAILHVSPTHVGYAAMILMLALSVGTVSHWHHSHDSETQIAALLPDKSLTPGAVRVVSLTDLCRSSDDDDLDPTVALPTQKAVFHKYGISTEGTKQNFQLDYLINPQLGGVDDVRNLWPQPYTSEWNAQAKDALERRLHQMVCERKVDLADAQRDIAENWIDAYKKYFHTSKPV